MNQEEFENYKEAGRIGKEIREYLKNFIKPKMKLIDIAEEVDKKIEEYGAKPAFPVNLSLNEIAAHSTPPLNDETLAEGLLKIDFGIEKNGYFSDLAFTLDLTPDNQFKEMIELNKEILEKTLNSLNYDSEVKDIGNSISKLLENKNFNIIKNLTGHSLGKYQIHTDPSIPNTKNEDKTQLKEKVIAVEPFLTTGIGEVVEGKLSEIFILQNSKNIRDSESRKILNFIEEEYKTKPFCKRWLDKKGFKTNFALKNLVREGILYNFPVLIEKSKSPVSQFEETIIFHNGEKIISTL